MNRSYTARKSVHDAGVGIFFHRVAMRSRRAKEKTQTESFPPQAAEDTKIAAKHLTINLGGHSLRTSGGKVCGNPFVYDVFGRFYHLKELCWDGRKPIISLLVGASDDRWSFRGGLTERDKVAGRIILTGLYWDLGTAESLRIFGWIRETAEQLTTIWIRRSSSAKQQKYE